MRTSDTDTCATCAYWQPFNEPGNPVGHCRHFPPMHMGKNTWPVTSGDSWCGSWREATTGLNQPIKRPN